MRKNKGIQSQLMSSFPVQEKKSGLNKQMWTKEAEQTF